MSATDLERARALARRITPGRPQPGLTAEIAACEVPEEARAGLHLLNGDWEAAHRVVQPLGSREAAYWHALVHRHEPDVGNAKYWLRRVGAHRIHARLVEAAHAEGRAHLVAPGGRWDPFRFADLYADPDHRDWTRRLDALEMRSLLEACLEP